MAFAPGAAADYVAAVAAAATAVLAEEQAEAELHGYVERERVAAAAEEHGDERCDEPGDTPTDEPDEPTDEPDDDVEADEAGAASAFEVAAAEVEVEAAALDALNQLMEVAGSEGADVAAEAILTVPSIWCCCESNEKSAAWKCGDCNLWAHRSCQKRASNKDAANPLCKSCFAESVRLMEESSGARGGTRGSKRARGGGQ